MNAVHRVFTPLRSCTARLGRTWGPVLLTVVASLWCGGPRAGIAEARPGTLILVGGVLRFDQRKVWNRITENAADLVIIAAASDRPKLYGEFARRALQRHGAFAELLPLAVDSAEFGIDRRRAVTDRALVEKVREASGVFFVGGAPQRLATVLIGADGSANPLGRAVAEVHAAGGVIVGGIPGPAGPFTGIDALEVLADGGLSPARLYRGLDLVPEGWLVDQHAFSPGRLAEILVAMHQLAVPRGMGIGADTSAVIDGEEVEVIGDEGVLLIELPRRRAGPRSADGFRLGGVRLSYLEHGDRFDLSTLEVEPAAAKRDGFEIEFGGEGHEGHGPREHERPLVADLFAPGRLPRLLREALDGSRGEAIGLAFPENAGGDERGFRFRFHSVPESAGWLSVDSGMERYTIVNIGLEVSVVRRTDMPEP